MKLISYGYINLDIYHTINTPRRHVNLDIYQVISIWYIYLIDEHTKFTNL